MSKSNRDIFPSPPRSNPRVHSISGIVLNYEGQSDLTYVRSPDVSTRGMFVNTTRQFPEGAILNVRFRLALSGASVRARGEVRYCLPGVGIGLEFMDLDRQTRQRIEREVLLNEASELTRGRPSLKAAAHRRSPITPAKARAKRGAKRR